MMEYRRNNNDTVRMCSNENYYIKCSIINIETVNTLNFVV